MSCGQHGDEELDEAALRVLVSRAAAADPDAWEAIYRRSHPRLFSYARRRLPSDPAADDAVSETMLRALDKINGFTWRGAGFDAWLYGILRNVVLESHRQAGRTTASHAPEVSVPGPLDALVRRDELAEVRTQGGTQLVEERSAWPSPGRSPGTRGGGGRDQELLELRVGSVLGRKAGASAGSWWKAAARRRSVWAQNVAGLSAEEVGGCRPCGPRSPNASRAARLRLRRRCAGCRGGRSARSLPSPPR